MPSNTVTTGLKTNIRKGLGNSGTFFSVVSPTNTNEKVGRVTRVVLGQESCTEDEWELYQKNQALYGVFYRDLQIGLNGQILEVGSEKFAYCFHANFRRIPVKNEIVKLIPEVGVDIAAQNGNLFRQKVYWTDILPAWNHPHLNSFPNLQENSNEISDPLFTDQGNKVNPLQLCPGDITIEGRHGESLRFGGTCYKGSPVAVEGTDGKAYAIFRVGQGTETGRQGDIPIYEDINQDSSSIYITTAHIVPLNQAFLKRNAWKDLKYIEAKDYNKPQILLTSDRLWLNGRDDIEMTAKNVIGLSSGQVNVDGKEQISFDAEKIYLGDKSQKEEEPVLKGATTTKMLSNLIDQFITLLNTIMEAGTRGNGDPGAFIGSLESIASYLLPELKSCKSQLDTLHSKKVYTE